MSDLYYVIGRWFTILMVAIAFCVLVLALEVWDSVVSFLMCVGLVFVGAAANYKGGEHDLHYAAACVSAGCSVVWVACVEPLALLMLMVALVGVVDRKRWLLWGEMACFLMVFWVIAVERLLH